MTTFITVPECSAGDIRSDLSAQNVFIARPAGALLGGLEPPDYSR